MEWVPGVDGVGAWSGLEGETKKNELQSCFDLCKCEIKK